MYKFLVLVALWVFGSDGFAAEFVCGFHGTLEERIADCAQKGGALATRSKNGIVLKLVTSSGRKYANSDMWLDTDKNILWTDVLGVRANFPTAEYLCQKATLNWKGYLGNWSFQVPSRKDVLAIYQYRELFPSMDTDFWLEKGRSYYLPTYDAERNVVGGWIESSQRDVEREFHGVRCIAHL